MPAPKLQVGIVITRKEGNSVQRHRTKRQIKEIVRKIVTALPDKYKFKLIIKAKKTQTSYWEIKYEIVQNLERIQRDAQHYKTV
jgi:ribonuclease P protein component